MPKRTSTPPDHPHTWKSLASMVVTRCGQVTQSSASISAWIRPRLHGERPGGAAAQLFQLGVRPGEHVRLALQDRGQGADELRTVGASEAAGTGDVKLGAASRVPV